MADFFDTADYGSGDLAPTTLFGRRSLTVTVENDPVGDHFTSAEISEGSLQVETAPGTYGNVYLYHDSVYAGPYLDLLDYALDASEFVIVFSEVPTANLATTIALRGHGGTLIYRPTIPAGTEIYRLSLADHEPIPGTVDLSTIYETRWFFRFYAGASFAIDSITIIPEPSTAHFLITGILLGWGIWRCRIRANFSRTGLFFPQRG